MALNVVLVMMWLGLTAYALFAGADFGAGVWDLFAGGAERGKPQRTLIERSIAPIWEANHVWLIFVLVILWSVFPVVFAAIASTLYIPLTVAAIGIILRGSGFAFRKSIDELKWQRIFGATFASSSLLTPFFLGTVAGAVASGRVPPGNVTGDIISSWVNPTSLLGGTLAVGVCAYLAAVYLTGDADRTGDAALVEAFRTRGIATAFATGALALAGIWILAEDAPQLFDGLVGKGLPLIILSAIGGVLSVYLLSIRRFVAARGAAGLAVTAIVWGWAAAQYPQMLVGYVSIEEAAAGEATVTAVAWSLGIGTALFGPALVWMFWLFQKESGQARKAPKEGS